MRNCFATLLRSHAWKVAHLAVKHKSGTLVFLCGFGMDRKKERKKAGTAAVGGGGGEVGQSCSSATQTDHSGKNASLVLVC